MNEINQKIFYDLGKNQFYDFIRSALGMKAFLSGENVEIRTVAEEDEEGTNRSSRFPKLLAYEYRESQRINRYFVDAGDADSKIFRDADHEYEAETYFDSLGDDLLWYLLQGIKGIESFELKESESHIIDGKTVFERLRPGTLNFIVGAGINFDFGIGDWDALVDDMRSEISLATGATDTVIRKFEEKMCNTNYIAPQILKDIDEKKYYNALYNNLYGTFSAGSVSQTTNPGIVDTNLFQVARICASQHGASSVLTFNYDDLIEQVLSNNFPATKYISEYNSSKNKLGIPHVTVSHSHGFFPSVVATSTPHSIVLSCYEYMEGYLNGYAKKKLRSQLKHSNIIIGNSMADYEEQKVFYSNHRRNRAHFDFIFLKSNGTENLWMDRYQTIYFIKMGVIPVFFSDFDEMNGYLKRL